MTTDRLTLRTTLALEPGVGRSPLVTTTLLDLAKTLGITVYQRGVYSLISDPVASVSFGPITNAHLVLCSVGAPGAKVRARITTSDGALQAIPFDDVLLLVARGAPVTALDLLRTPGVLSDVDVLLGSLA